MIPKRWSCFFNASLKTLGLSMLVALQLSCILACGRVSDQWHRYGGEGTVVSGQYADQVAITSHGWKIIDETKDKSGPAYEWGWEIVLEAKGQKQTPGVYYGIRRMEYILRDKDGFELAKSTFPMKDLVHEVGTTETYIHTSTLPAEKAKRASSGSCIVELGL